jgi:hypothetical protein
MGLNENDPKFPYVSLTVVYGNLAGLFKDEKDYRNAEMYLEKNIAIYTDKIMDNVELARSRMDLAELYIEENKVADATGLFNMVKTQVPYFDRDLRITWLQLGAALAQKNNNTTGELHFLKELPDKRFSCRRSKTAFERRPDIRI